MCLGTVFVVVRDVTVPDADSANVEHVYGLTVGGDVDPEALERRRRIALLKRDGCGCSTIELCKHYYLNERRASGAEGQTEGDTDEGLAATSLVQTFFDVSGLDQLVTPWSSPRLHWLLTKRMKRL